MPILSLFYIILFIILAVYLTVIVTKASLWAHYGAHRWTNYRMSCVNYSYSSYFMEHGLYTKIAMKQRFSQFFTLKIDINTFDIKWSFSVWNKTWLIDWLIKDSTTPEKLHYRPTQPCKIMFSKTDQQRVFAVCTLYWGNCKCNVPCCPARYLRVLFTCFCTFYE